MNRFFIVGDGLNDEVLIKNSIIRGSLVDTEAEADFVIKNYDDQLELIDKSLNMSLSHPLFSKGFSHRLKTLNKTEPLIKAISKLESESRIGDFTFGLGADSLAMAAKGFNVLAFERSPILFVFNSIALQRGPEKGFPFSAKIKYFFTDAKEACRTWKNQGVFEGFEAPEIIYLDPMFVEKKKSALPGKEMQILKNLVGGDLDKDELFTMALDVCKNRVLYKRPLHAPQINDGPQHIFKGKSHKIEMYLRN